MAAITVMASSQPRMWSPGRHRERCPLGIKVAGLPKRGRRDKHIEGVQRGVEFRGLPRTRRRSIHASRNPSRAPSASLRDRLRRPGQTRLARSRSSRVRGISLGRTTARPGPGEGPAAVMMVRAPRLSVGHDRGRRCGRTRDTVPSPRMAAAEGREGTGTADQ